MKKQRGEWKKIGAVGVDSGTLMIIDPCYATNFTSEDYEKYVVNKSNKQAVKVPFPKGHQGRAVIFASGIGDGMYDVYGKFEILRGWGERITEVRIVMSKDIEKITNHFYGRDDECKTGNLQSV